MKLLNDGPSVARVTGWLRLSKPSGGVKMSEVLTIQVHITSVEEVKGKTGEACMIAFDGTAEGPYFTGICLPTGVDTQSQKYAGDDLARHLSARYMLVGKDSTGKDCRIFVQNEGAMASDGSIRTTPKLYTDSQALAWLETAELYGTISPREGGVTIHFWDK